MQHQDYSLEAWWGYAKTISEIFTIALNLKAFSFCLKKNILLECYIVHKCSPMLTLTKIILQHLSCLLKPDKIVKQQKLVPKISCTSQKVHITLKHKNLARKKNGQGVQISSVKIRFLWESASNPSDDDMGCVVSGPDAFLQHLLLDQRRKESWVGRQTQK